MAPWRGESCCDSWGVPTVQCGDMVRERDGRHVAEVRSWRGTVVRLAWVGTGWVSELPARDLVRHYED